MLERKKMSLVIDARMVLDSGIGSYIKNLLPFFIKKYSVTLLGNERLLRENFNSDNVSYINFTATIYSLKEQILYPFILPKYSFLWSPHINLSLLPLRAKKIVTTIHDVNHISLKENYSLLERIVAKLFYKNAVRKSNQIITVSNFSKSEIIKYTKAAKSKIKVIYNGVSKEFYENVIKNHDYKNFKYILYVGNVKPHKNLATLIDAYNKLPKNIQKEYKLLLLGKKDGFINNDNNLLNFESQNKNKNIVFTGFVPQNYLYSIYKSSSLFVFPTLYEGFGLPLIEAMASKTPILCSDIPSLKEVGKDTVNYFDPKNTKELKIKILQILQNQEIEKQNIERAYIRSKKFSWELSAEEHIKVFDELLT